MSASGAPLWHVDSAGAGLITGSVTISNAAVNVDVTVSDYVSIVGSPNYNLPITGSVQATVSSLTGSVEVSNNAFKPLSIIGSPNYNLPVSVASLLGSVEVSSIVGTSKVIGSVEVSNYTGSVHVKNTVPVIGSVEISNSSLNVDVTIGDYLSIIGSPNYNLPVIGSVEISTIRTMPTTTVTATNLDIRDLASASDSVTAIGSVQVSSIVSNVGVTQQTSPWVVIGSAQASNLLNPHPVIGSVEISNSSLNIDVTVSDYVSVIGSPNYNLPVIGSVQVSSVGGTVTVGTHGVTQSTTPWIVEGSAIQKGTWNVGISAGTNLIGSVVADIVGLSTSDYVSVVGSPNYNLPIIGSVAISTIRTMPTTTVTATNLDIRDLTSTSDSVNAIGSVEVSNNAFKPLFIVGSPNYELPVSATISTGSGMVIYSGAITNIAKVDTGNLAIIGSVQVSSITGVLPAGTNVIGSVVNRVERFGTASDGSVWVTNSATVIRQPVERQMIAVVVTGSASTTNTNGKIWVGPDSSRIVNRGIELVANQIWEVNNYIGSVVGITDAGSILVGYWEM